MMTLTYTRRPLHHKLRCLLMQIPVRYRIAMAEHEIAGLKRSLELAQREAEFFPRQIAAHNDYLTKQAQQLMRIQLM